MTVIDADTHVVEARRTFEYLDGDMRSLRPKILVDPESEGQLEYWFMEGRAFLKNISGGRETDVDNATGTTQGTREMSDVRRRLAHMDELGVDVHVLYPTMFLRPLTIRPQQEYALSWSYNRWMADIWAAAPERLRWTVIPPVLNMDKAIEEINFGKEHGACGVFMRGVEGNLRLPDPYLFPLYEEASRLDMPICVHAAAGHFGTYDLFLNDRGIAQFKLPAIGAFHSLLMERVPERFPDLRWAFMEVSSQWVPYALNDMGLRVRKRGAGFTAAEVLKENRVYVACQTEDDLDYVLEYAGEDNIVIGSDYGHHDTSSEIEALRRLREDGKIPAGSADKIMGDNARALYAL